MKVLRLVLVVGFLSVLAAACSSPTVPYPQPKDEGGEPPPTHKGITIPHR